MRIEKGRPLPHRVGEWTPRKKQEKSGELQLLNMPDPLVEGELFQKDAFMEHPALGPGDNEIPDLWIQRLQ